ncbi:MULTISPECIES: hypothetical protein [Ralstonia]|jgi:hypothetical protein|uniref:Uncharacterized protein n=2 Tax=Ralstonia pickettii TaxID=329 RepID=R0CMM1_RALPI|nr:MULTISPECIES: hypothetical protein [Ralstonia]ENZ77926.1 hypothetical protein OR214_02202 [Ralstonia pickettii OR214]MCM3581977.1 hypothetical protein [Ralstonia pickettii]
MSTDAVSSNDNERERAMGKRKFRLKQANMAGRDWSGLDFRSYIDRGDTKRSLSDPVIASVRGDEIDYGKLFAYCFRRFGYPDRGWDDYKQLVSYYLTTPNPDLVLNITPYVGNSSVLSLRFLVGSESSMAIDAYARRDRTAWEQRSLDWAEKQGLPDWMPEWLGIYNSEFRQAFPQIPIATSWREVLDFPFAMGEEGSRPYVLTSRVAEFRQTLHESYKQVEAWPAYYLRPANLHDWNDDDPLKPLAQAAIEALRDLSSPVGVRDQSINAFGQVESGRIKVKAAASAGYPSGALGNTAAKEFAELHELVLKLGKGSVKRGISKVLSAVGAV